MLNKMFTDSIIYSDQQIQNIYEITKKQSDSQHWNNHRKGRLTASKFKDIYTATKKLKNNDSAAYPDSLALAMGYTTPPQTWKMKHGINSEPHAKQKFKQFFKKTRQNPEVSDPGMTLFKSHLFISVSPDLEINCSCHGPGLVEIKRPATIIGKVPSAENNKHLETINEQPSLKKKAHITSKFKGNLQLQADNIATSLSFNSRVI